MLLILSEARTGSVSRSSGEPLARPIAAAMSPTTPLLVGWSPVVPLWNRLPKPQDWSGPSSTSERKAVSVDMGGDLLAELVQRLVGDRGIHLQSDPPCLF